MITGRGPERVHCYWLDWWHCRSMMGQGCCTEMENRINNVKLRILQQHHLLGCVTWGNLQASIIIIISKSYIAHIHVRTKQGTQGTEYYKISERQVIAVMKPNQISNFLTEFDILLFFFSKQFAQSGINKQIIQIIPCLVSNWWQWYHIKENIQL